jgi:hypothetical protein
MASFLRLCIHCSSTVRFASLYDIPNEVACDDCKTAIVENKRSARREAKRKVKAAARKRARQRAAKKQPKKQQTA